MCRSIADANSLATPFLNKIVEGLFGQWIAARSPVMNVRSPHGPAARVSVSIGKIGEGDYGAGFLCLEGGDTVADMLPSQANGVTAA